MPGQRGTEKRRLPAQVLVRLTAEAQVVLNRHADARTLTVASLAREVLVDGIAALETEDRRPVKLRGRAAAPAEDVALLRTLIDYTNRLNGMLKVATVALGNAGHEEEAGAFASLRIEHEDLHDRLCVIIERLRKIPVAASVAEAAE